MKKTIVAFFVVFLSVGSVFAASPTDLIKNGTVIYELPYAGTTPESPLYIFKQFRDEIIEFFTRDYIKKAEFLLVSSDKRAHIALILASEGKTSQSVDVMADAEERALRIAPLLIESKKQGAAPSGQFVYTLQLSNVKHKEVIQELAKLLPQGQEQDALSSLLDLNQRVAHQLQGL
jgi:hypothetical protein